ncbi:MAG: alpha/beta hydrolase [Ruminococcus sp.]
MYDTKAYATDERDVKKTAYVYLPYGYSEEKEYNILYLMHGTGDDEKYWLKTNPYNKTMLDNMIADGDIEPLIVVTPTFYVEDDCADDLDQLTYSFAKELRNDLMPEIESVYSTYAKSADDEGFAESRDHRAFAGLSRGAVTMYHSALCQSLDYFHGSGHSAEAGQTGLHLKIPFRQAILQNCQFIIYMWQAATSTSPCLDRFGITRLCWI